MRIVHLTTRDSMGGAFLGSYTLHQGLREIGVDSQILTARKYTQDPTVHLPTATLPSRLLHGLRMWREKQPLNAYPNRAGALFSPAVVSARLTPALRRLNPDLIHLHWIAHGFVRPQDLPGWKRPIVWTLRDMWPFTGGCHYSAGCNNYQGQCGRCPLLTPNPAQRVENDLSRAQWHAKKQSWSSLTIHFVGISKWLADCARSSSLGASHRVHHIPNAIDPQIFAPKPKLEARTELGLPHDSRIVLYGAVDADGEGKGYSHFVEALHKLAAQPVRPSLHVATFGNGDVSRVQNAGLPSTHFGYIADKNKLATLYSAADVMLVPSLEEAFGKTAAEALSCRTPVVCFDTTGLKDIVEHQQCGYRAAAFSSDDLANGITWVLENDQRHAALAQRGRAKVLEEFSITRVAEQYRSLYAQILQEQPQTATPGMAQNKNGV